MATDRPTIFIIFRGQYSSVFLFFADRPTDRPTNRRYLLFSAVIIVPFYCSLPTDRPPFFIIFRGHYFKLDYLNFQISDEDSSLTDEAYLSKQLEAQVCLKKNLIYKLNIAKSKYDAAVKKREEELAIAKIEAYKHWRAEEQKKLKAQDEHSKKLVKTMKDAVNTGPATSATVAVSNVLSNVDGKKKN